MEFRRLFRGGVTVVDNEIRLIGRDAEISREDVEFLFLRVLLLIQRSHFSVTGSTLCINVASHDNVKHSCVVRDDAFARNYSIRRESLLFPRGVQEDLCQSSQNLHTLIHYVRRADKRETSHDFLLRKQLALS